MTWNRITRRTKDEWRTHGLSEPLLFVPERFVASLRFNAIPSTETQDVPTHWYHPERKRFVRWNILLTIVSLLIRFSKQIYFFTQSWIYFQWRFSVGAKRWRESEFESHVCFLTTLRKITILFLRAEKQPGLAFFFLYGMIIWKWPCEF